MKDGLKTKWIFACGLRRSGSTLQYHLVREVVVPSVPEDGLDLGWTTWQEFDEAFDMYDSKYEYIVLKCHVHMPRMSENCARIWRDGRGYGVFVHRNMYDTMASMLRLNKANVGKPHRNLIYVDLKALVNEANNWLDEDNVLVSQYDDIVSETGMIRECHRIAEHVGVKISGSRCVDIAKSHSLKEQKKRQPKRGFNSKYGLWANHIATGKSGVWKTELSKVHVNFCTLHTEELRKRLGYE